MFSCGEEVGYQYLSFHAIILIRSSNFIFEVQWHQYLSGGPISKFLFLQSLTHRAFPLFSFVACISYTSSSFYDYCDMYFLSSTFLMTLNSVYILSWSVIGLMRSQRLLMYFHLIWNILQESQRRIEWITRVVQKKRGRWNAIGVIS